MGIDSVGNLLEVELGLVTPFSKPWYIASFFFYSQHAVNSSQKGFS